MKLTRHMELVVYAAIGFHVLGLIFYFYRVDSFVKDVFVAPLYFLVPSGVGLFVFSLFGTHTRLVGLIGGLRLTLSFPRFLDSH